MKKGLIIFVLLGLVIELVMLGTPLIAEEVRKEEVFLSAPSKSSKLTLNAIPNNFVFNPAAVQQKL
ncbi:hypothetical protein AZF37_09305 [endosymbiont 'TC1' of Trimyema compressum]|uniref:hypothetical protein n=1 Tax=endosymbiont 'TC1' of Trimyema compressum TaxID=243899 RepID=UPI0007F06669|nr:hypothetical protein [endosymbiont 'TC1' of Trimyema compressum]AMP21315.1 hypothetical protein AZF37_09305 [endosymbiont 'TC1' of Trimyema compressum]